MALFGKEKYTLVKIRKKDIPSGLWTKCSECGALTYNKTLKDNQNVCPKCDFHMYMSAQERVRLLLDEDTFEDIDDGIMTMDPLEFKGPKAYKQKLQEDQEKTGLRDAVLTGTGLLEGKKIDLGVTDSAFIMGSMGSVVGEKTARLVEHATANKLPLVIVSGSGGGARMYEGIYSLMQMAKTCAAIGRHQEAGLLYISILTNPTMGGVMASFAGVGDIIIAEPKALVGFAGPRVIEQTIRQKLPQGFQRSEFMMAHGLIDMIVKRKEMKTVLSRLLTCLSSRPSKAAS